MELHGKNPLQNVIAIIPARYASMRLPGKMLREIGGISLIVHTYRQALKARNVSQVIVATDDERIASVVRECGGKAIMTSTGHRSGSDRIAEVAADMPLGSIIVNVQGDEPTISPETIEQAVSAHIADPLADIVTTSEPIDSAEDLDNPNIVKVVSGENGYALYFSRSCIPYPRDAAIRNQNINPALRNDPQILSIYRKHTGLYVYTREFLLKFAGMSRSRLEQIEMLEQLRALENGARIKVVDAVGTSIGVDTIEDLEKVRRIIETNG